MASSSRLARLKRFGEIRWFERSTLAEPSNELVLEGVDAQRGALPVLHGVNLTVGADPVAVLGRNGAGKTTLCHAIMGLVPVSRGSIRFGGVELAGKPPEAIAEYGLTIVPQGRRIFASLTVDEHMRLMAGGRPGPWNVARVYATFPRLAARKANYGSQLSGGEQQMLAIARALLTNPRLMILDEPSEGLAPLIVEHLLEVLRMLGAEGTSILLVEQKLRVGTAAAQRIALMANGQIALMTDAERLLADDRMQQKYLGMAAALEDS
jgi:branched-chain amino acid transport system ATP-binding protein